MKFFCVFLGGPLDKQIHRWPSHPDTTIRIPESPDRLMWVEPDRPPTFEPERYYEYDRLTGSENDGRLVYHYVGSRQIHDIEI